MYEVTKWLVLAFLSWMSLVDFKKKAIPFYLILGFGMLILVFRIFFASKSWTETAGVVLIGAGFFLMGRFTREAIGYGDCWAILFLGVYAGAFEILEIVLTASVMTALFSIGYCMKYGWKSRYTFPYIPFLTVAYMVVMIL